MPLHPTRKLKNNYHRFLQPYPLPVTPLHCRSIEGNSRGREWHIFCADFPMHIPRNCDVHVYWNIAAYAVHACISSTWISSYWFDVANRYGVVWLILHTAVKLTFMVVFVSAFTRKRQVVLILAHIICRNLDSWHSGNLFQWPSYKIAEPKPLWTYCLLDCSHF